jgi:hypothetical protein
MPDTYEPKVLTSLKELQEEGPASTLDLNEDAWEYGAPPPHDVYSFKLFPGKECFSYVRSNPKDPKSDIIITAVMEAKVQSDNPEYDGSVVFTRVSTRLGRGKNISTMAGLLVKLGYGEHLKKDMQAGKLTPKRLAQILEAALKKEPVCKGELDWRGAYSITNTRGDEEWVNKFNHYEDFPDNPDGEGKLHICQVKGKDGENHEIRAQAQITRWFGKNEEIPDVKQKKNSIMGKTSSPKLVLTPTMSTAPAAEATSPKVQVPADDDELILE